VQGADALQALDPGGLEILDCSTDEFALRLRSINHTLKRSLTDQRVFAGIGNAYSDEILLHAKLSPFKMSSKLTDEEVGRLLTSCQTDGRLLADRSLSRLLKANWPKRVEDLE